MRPPAERIPVPTDRLGPAYEGQWVERRLETDDLFDRYMAKIIGVPGFASEDMWAQLEGQVKLCALLFTDWNLHADDGPLPKPWLDPGAFLTLWLADYRAVLWLLDLAGEFARRVTRERRFDRILERMLAEGKVAHG